MFRCISYYFMHLGQFVALQHSVQNGPNWCKSSCHDLASEFFTMNAPDPPHGTLNSCFVVFCTIWLHLGPFGCHTKLSAKRAEVVQKFVPRSRVRIFRNERTRSTPLDSKLMFLCVSHYLDVFGTVWLPTKLGAKRAEVVQKFVPWSRFGIFCNECTRSTLLAHTSCFSVFRTIWVHLG